MAVTPVLTPLALEVVLVLDMADDEVVVRIPLSELSNHLPSPLGAFLRKRRGW